MPTRKTLSVRVFLVSINAFNSYSGDARGAPIKYHGFPFSKAFCEWVGRCISKVLNNFVLELP